VTWLAVLSIVLVAAAATVAVLRRRFVSVDVFGTSMEPTLRPGQRVLVRRVPLARVFRGQLVVIAPPADLPNRDGNPPWLVKRAVALPGDPIPTGVTVAARDNRVPAGHLAVLGDNPTRSFDSRAAGLFPAEALLGVVVRVL
jgi:signal peptidase I